MGRFQISFLFLVACMCSASFGFTCKKAERNVLLKMKHSLNDRCKFLSSWVGQDCCSWYGVGCHNVTGNVIKLDLRTDMYCLEAGEVNPALLELKYLTYLDLSFVDFNGSRFPDFFGSMRKLQHLDLSDSYFSGKVPSVLGNLTELVFLDLSSACFGCETERNTLEWASTLVNLKHLSLGEIDLSQALDSLDILYKLPSLLNLSFYGCQLGNSHRVLTNLTVSSPILRHLDLGVNLFTGSIPHFIQNLSSIRFLYLSYNHLNSSIPSWLADKTHLEYLYLGYNHLNRVDGGLMSILSRLCRLKSLDLSGNRIQEEVSEFHVYNFSKCSRYDLEDLYISSNKISGYLPIIGSFSSLVYLDISYNNIEHIPLSLEGLSSLSYLALSNNNLSVIPTTIGNLSSLKTLELSYNDLEIIPPSLGSLSSLSYLGLSNNHLRVLSLVTGSLLSLKTLDLSHNDLENLPPSLGGLSSLETLDLSYNDLENLPPSFGQLSSLVSLDLSYNNLSVVNQASLSNLSSLQTLDLSSNSAILHFSPDWIPPFQLASLSILPCKLNSAFPKWISTQKNISYLDLTDTGIFGPLPDNIGITMPSLQIMQLSNNHINGSIPRTLCDLAGLYHLNLKSNMLSGTIPDCWMNSRIGDVDLSSNKLSGPIPNSLAPFYTLRLNNNSIEGDLPLSWSNSAYLELVDMSWNKLHGKIPPWNGAKFPSLQILILRENRLEGIIPPQLCSIQMLHIINLANNNLVGAIPQCFGYFKAMGSMLHSPDIASNSNISIAPASLDWSAVEDVKGQDREYTTVLDKLVNMDLSCNHFVGAIPTEITSLSLLDNLNLSHNHFSGMIPVDIGKMKALESLDLSSNNLSGSIPESMASLDSLSNLNLSFNNLQGKIPTGRHFDTLDDPSIYMNNPGLCGDPLPKKCPGENSGAYSPTSMVVEDKEDNKHEKMWLYLIIMLGFATGFWGVIGTLAVHKIWRIAYFRMAEELADWIINIRVAVRIARVNRGR